MRDSPKFRFESRQIRVDRLNNRKILAAKADLVGNLFVYLDDFSLEFINIVSGDVRKIADLNGYGYPASGSFEIHHSDDNAFVALTCTHQGSEHVLPLNSGVVISLSDSREVMTLSNGSYHTELTPFPVCFVKRQGKNLIVHATDWNRLDITDLQTGVLLTERDLACKPDLSDHEDFVFTEWPGRLLCSPGQTRIATIGWVWHPIGHAYSFDLVRWLDGQKWESDASIHQRSYAIWDYFWDSSFTWISDERLCIWGVDENSMEPIDSATVFNAETGERLISFAGPTNDVFFFDQYLFSGLSKQSESHGGLSIWDVDTGKLLHVVPEFAFLSYCRSTREFFQFEDPGLLVATRWIDDLGIKSVKR